MVGGSSISCMGDVCDWSGTVWIGLVCNLTDQLRCTVPNENMQDTSLVIFF